MFTLGNSRLEVFEKTGERSVGFLYKIRERFVREMSCEGYVVRDVLREMCREGFLRRMQARYTLQEVCCERYVARSVLREIYMYCKGCFTCVSYEVCFDKPVTSNDEQCALIDPALLEKTLLHKLALLTFRILVATVATFHIVTALSNIAYLWWKHGLKVSQLCFEENRVEIEFGRCFS